MRKDADIYNQIPKYKGISIRELNNVVEKWHRYIIDEYIPDMLHYNLNDVFIVAEIVRLYSSEIKSRYAVTASYGVDVLSSSRSNMADILFQKFYTKFSGIPYKQWKDGRTIRTAMSLNKIIFDCVQFKTPELQNLLADMKKLVLYKVSKDAFSRTVKIGDTEYNLATGGLHSADRPMEYGVQLNGMELIVPLRGVSLMKRLLRVSLLFFILILLHIILLLWLIMVLLLNTWLSLLFAILFNG